MRTFTTKQATTKTLPYDVAEQLRTPQRMLAYVAAWLDEAPEGATGIASALGHVARAQAMKRHVVVQ